MEGSILGAGGDGVNPHGIDVFQAPEDKDLPTLTLTPRGVAQVGWYLPDLEPSVQRDSKATLGYPTSTSGAGGQCWA